ncbi:hypothetical protein MMC07_008047 [Pseudocyphellaria aurata]|nr:hypothetical protein [Pseudocyphellaria aurata]
MLQSKPSGVNPATKPLGSPKTAAERQQAARETGLQIKQLQEAALADLSQHKLFILLYIRSDPPVPNDFHWGFYNHKTKAGGIKYHVKNIGDGWIADHGSKSGMFKSHLLCVLIEIGSIPVNKEGTLDQIMRSLDGSVNSIPGITCRVWLWRIVRLLIQAGLLHCDDLAGLQQECIDYGNACQGSAAANEQPRPVRVSSRCS